MPPKLREPPVLLARLLTEDSPEAKNFRLNIRSYNNLLSFASKGISGKLYVHGMHIKCKYCNERLYIYDVIVICYTILYCIVLLVLYLKVLSLGPGDSVGRQRGPPLYKITGQMYHCLPNVFPNDGHLAAFSQLYVYDNNHRIIHSKNYQVTFFLFFFKL